MDAVVKVNKNNLENKKKLSAASLLSSINEKNYSKIKVNRNESNNLTMSSLVSTTTEETTKLKFITIRNASTAVATTELNEKTRNKRDKSRASGGKVKFFVNY